jgi:hypothetical protein
MLVALRIGRLVADLPQRRPVLTPGSVHVGFAVDKVALGQVFLRVFWFSLVTVIPPWLCILMYHQGDEQYARWWKQFRDIVSPHRHEQKQLVMLENGIFLFLTLF